MLGGTLHDERSIHDDIAESYIHCKVEWIFTSRAENKTLVSIINSGFKGDRDDIVRQVIDSTGGFTIVLCGLKALLEHGIVLRLVSDRFPDAHV